MRRTLLRYRFARHIPPETVQAALILAAFGTESLHRESSVVLKSHFFFDPERLVCLLDIGTAIGRELDRLFRAFLSREIGRDEYEVESPLCPKLEEVLA